MAIKKDKAFNNLPLLPLKESLVDTIKVLKKRVPTWDM